LLKASDLRIGETARSAAAIGPKVLLQPRIKECRRNENAQRTTAPHQVKQKIGVIDFFNSQNSRV
ncbi:MAG: hypothetical protein V3T13_07470, partial [Hyphomicrobium sp.]